MIMADGKIPGVIARTIEEEKEKIEAVRSGARPILGLARAKYSDEFRLTAVDFTDPQRNLADSVAALNAVCAWVQFPAKLRNFLDCLIAAAGDATGEPVTLTNLQIGKQIRVGRAAKDSSTAKAISRNKKKLVEWQNEHGFELVEIIPGEFDAARKKNNPGSYNVIVAQWIPEIVALAAASRDWHKSRNLRLKAIRRAARAFINSLPDAPPIRGYQPKELSEGQKFDRFFHSVFNNYPKKLALAAQMNFSLEELHARAIHEMNKAYLKAKKAAGLTSEILTADRDSPDVKSSYWDMARCGRLLEEDLLALDDLTDVKTVFPRQWRDGKFVDHSNTIELKSDDCREDKTASDNLQEVKNSACNSLKIKDRREDIFERYREDIFDRNQPVSAGQNDARPDIPSAGQNESPTDAQPAPEAAETTDAELLELLFPTAENKMETDNRKKAAKTEKSVCKPLTTLTRREDIFVPQNASENAAFSPPKSVCRSCSAPVIWRANVDTQKKMPIDAAPDADNGNIALLDDGTHFRILTSYALESFRRLGGELYRSHFDACPQNNRWERRRRRPT